MSKVNPDGNQCIKTVRHVHFCHQVSVSAHFSLDVKGSMGYCMKDECSLFQIILKDSYILSTYMFLTVAKENNLIFHLPWHPSHTLVAKPAIMNYSSYAISP
jgi:hypothetical protein